MKVIVALLILVISIKASPVTSYRQLDVYKNILMAKNVRVVGGQDAERHQFPYQASLRYSNNGGPPRHICGGILIHNEWVLTAGHCKPSLLGIYQIVLGQLIQEESHADIQKFAVKQFIVHPKFSGGVSKNDIALIKLAKPAKLTEAVQLAVLPNNEQCDAVVDVLLSGWGYQYSWSTTTPAHLQWVQIPRLSSVECKDQLNKLAGKNPFDFSMICTTSNEGKKESACNGDSGGPLALTEGKVVVGIVSWGITPCGAKNAPTVYTRICSHQDFIDKYVKHEERFG